SEQVARAVEHGAQLVWVRSEPRAAGGSLALGALESLGLDWLAVDAHLIPSGHEPDEAMSCAARLAGLLGRALVVVGAEALAERSGAPAAFDALARAAVPVIASGRCAWNADWLPRSPLLVDATPLTVHERETAWRASSLAGLIERDPELRQTLLALRMTPDDIAETARYAHALSEARGEQLDAAVVRAAVRRIASAQGMRGDRASMTSEAASLPGEGPTFDDLVLPEHVLESLQRLVRWGRHRDEVDAHGPLQRGRGIAALFAGNPGTGKTLAAHVIAEELSVDLFQVELSSIVDKYIGETEKHLEKVFEAAEALDVVLFFDEADALFGSRSEVHDARDRYANQEIAYLLQRMERFEGITILATNLRGNLDRAFSRRMSFIINFPDPDPAIRRRLWQHHLALLPELDDADPVNVGYLAEEAELAGGDIRNIVLAAAYDAVSAGERVGMRHVVAATLGEYRKLGRVLPEHGFVPGA
ncbi:MAG TPA: ATP-binding protein, partial [Jatrophihabitantaceae bacterium]|nr:ATP-binding protein [Jatrophihabitantaceae bacterium]